MLHLAHLCGGMVVPASFALISYHLFFAFPLLCFGKCRALVFNITLYSSIGIVVSKNLSAKLY
jgi:hypothetical protein